MELTEIELHHFGDIALSHVELQMVNLIQHQIDNVLRGTSKLRGSAIQWIYGGTPQIGHVSLEECCGVINLPYELIRIRMQFELFSKSISWINLDSELPIVIKEEIEFHYPELFEVSLLVWQNPGINLLEINTDNKLIQKLITNNLAMKNEFNQFWLTCRNPVISKNIHWTGCWRFYD